MKKHSITIADGDGIGPEIMKAVLFILSEAGAPLEYEKVEIGKKIFEKGESSGIPKATWDSIKKTKVLLKAPISTPQGGGYKSINVTLRTSLGLYANIRPCISYSPFIPTKHEAMDLVIIRENEEDLYTGIEYRQTQDLCHSIKMISRPGSEKIIRYGFEYAIKNGRKKVSCFTKDNILKMSDGLFHKLFDEIGTEYPDLEKEHTIIDIGTALLADKPQNYDVIILQNLYGDILSDVAAQISGSLGLAGSSNIGNNGAMFEAVHGSAPDIAGKNIANPSGLLLAAIYMLVHLKETKIASLIHNAWLTTIEEGFHTADIFSKQSKKKVGTQEFSKEVVSQFGKLPKIFKSINFSDNNDSPHSSFSFSKRDQKRELIGVDLYFFSSDLQSLLKELQKISSSLKLKKISNRGIEVWPQGQEETFCIDQWRCRFLGESAIKPLEITQLLNLVEQKNLDFIKIENLYTFDGSPGYSI